MTTDKKKRISERLKSLRDQVVGIVQAAEEEEPSVADTALSGEPDTIVPEPETKETEAAERASDGEIAAALRRFTWDTGKATADPGPKEPEAAAPESDQDERSGEETESISTAASDKLLDELLEELHKEFAEDAQTASQQQPETSAPAEQSAENAEPRAAAFPADLLAGIAAGIREDQNDRNAGTDPDEATPAGNEPPASAEELTDQPPEENTEQLPPEEGADEQRPTEAAVGFTGFAELLARLKIESEERFNAWEKSVQEEEGSSDAATGTEGAEQEPDPADVAKLWEPHRERQSGTPGEPPDRISRAVDSEKEETHVFTEEDLKNLPREQDSDEGDSGELSEDEEELQGYTPRDFRLIRRRRYYRSGLVGGIMYFLFVVCVSVVLAAFAWLAADDMLSLNKEYLEAEVYVGEDMDVSQIATELQTKGLIRYRRLFTIFGKFFHAEDKIEPGTYTLSTKLDYRALIQNMHHYTGWTGEARATVKVTIPEGKTVMETFQILADHGVCPYETLMECAATETFNYDFLADIPKGDATRLEGYLFPDTYEFYADSTPKAAICRFLDNFELRIPERVSEQAAASGFTLREILIVASLIEKEAGDDTERPTIASVIYNRLQSTSYPYLQIDATIQYAMGEHKEHLTYEDLQVDSPYNTYLYPGLPPGPIANPGLASIRAALNPESTGYYFYALGKNGKHKFFSSYNEFQRFINSADYGG